MPANTLDQNQPYTTKTALMQEARKQRERAEKAEEKAARESDKRQTERDEFLAKLAAANKIIVGLENEITKLQAAITEPKPKK